MTIRLLSSFLPHVAQVAPGTRPLMESSLPFTVFQALTIQHCYGLRSLVRRCWCNVICPSIATNKILVNNVHLITSIQYHSMTMPFSACKTLVPVRGHVVVSTHPWMKRFPLHCIWLSNRWLQMLPSRTSLRACLERIASIIDQPRPGLCARCTAELFLSDVPQSAEIQCCSSPYSR